eukprot:2401322-Prymnesium_polylepis.1
MSVEPLIRLPPPRASDLRPRLLLLLAVEREQGDTRHLHDLESDTRNITNSVALTAEPSDQHLILRRGGRERVSGAVFGATRSAEGAATASCHALPNRCTADLHALPARHCAPPAAAGRPQQQLPALRPASLRPARNRCCSRGRAASFAASLLLLPACGWGGGARSHR